MVMTTSGKPVFAYPPDTEETRLCGIVQALRLSVQQSLQDDLHCLRSGHSTIVWKTIQSLTWMVIIVSKNSNNNNSILPVAFWKTQLERLYASMIMIFTAQIQTMLTRNPQLDVEALWREKQVHYCLRTLLDASSHQIIIWGVPTCFLVCRRQLAASLIEMYHEKSDSQPLLAILLYRSNPYKMVTYVASALFPGFTASDGALLWSWLQDKLSVEQQSLLQQQQQKSFPICFPHFHAQGYLYASMHSMGDNFTWVLFSPHEHSAPVDFFMNPVSTLLQEFDPSEEIWLWEDYLDISQAWHVLFRMHSPSSFTQCIMSPTKHDNDDDEELWCTYHQLCWQLRSTSIESTQVEEKIPQQHANHPTIASDCPMLQCMDAPPAVQGVTYITKGPTTYLAMSGSDFEL